MFLGAPVYFSKVIASPSTYPCQSVSDSFRFGDSYRISELCEFVYIFKIVIKWIQTWPYFFKMFSFIFQNCDKMNPSMFVLFILLKKLSFYIPSMANGHWPYFSTFYQTCDKIWLQWNYCPIYGICLQVLTRNTIPLTYKCQRCQPLTAFFKHIGRYWCIKSVIIFKFIEYCHYCMSYGNTQCNY